jgi:hypothetical protein
MEDPHVERLVYRVSASEFILYDNPDPVMLQHDLGTFALKEARLTVKPADHFSDEDEARRIIDPFLRAWEIAADLEKRTPRTIRFTFERAEIIDRAPPSPGSAQVLRARAACSIALTSNACIKLVCKTYPGPPRAFRSTPEVETGYLRWCNFRQGKEPLQSMAYAILTLVEGVGGNRMDRREKAGRRYGIESAVLNTIGDLCSVRGDSETARKFVTGMSDLSSAEKQWLEQAIRRVVLRIGEYPGEAPLPEITMADLPTL